MPWGRNKEETRTYFRTVRFELDDSAILWKWDAGALFVDCPRVQLPKPVLGLSGFLEFINATFSVRQRELVLEWASTFPGTSEKMALDV